MSAGDEIERVEAPPKSTMWNTMTAVAWSFFGVRKRGDHERSVAQLNPIHVVVAGFVGVLLLVAGLIVLVNWVVAK